MALDPKMDIIGSDGEHPRYDPEPYWKEWSINDIWRGGIGFKKIIPKLRDHVRDPEIYATYRVVSIDEITYVPVLERIYPDGTTYDLSITDRIFGVGFGIASEVYRLHVNNNVYPYAACPDTAMKIHGSLCKYARVFRITEDGELEVISKTYDSSGSFLSDMIPLELVSIHQVQNISTKVIPPFKITTRLKDNDRVIVYAYADNGNIVSKRELLVEESAFVRSIDESLKYVSHISLKTPYLSRTDNTIINYPLNLPMSSLNIKGVVHYTDGSQKEYDADGGKFSIEGITQLLSNIEGQQRDIVAFYNLDANEVSLHSAGIDGRRVKADYKLIVSNENVSYSVKLFPTVVWNGDIPGYSVKWFMLNMDKNICYDVTNKVEFLESTGGFNTHGFGYVQRKQVSVNLKSVSPSFNSMNHTQVVEFTLYGKPSAVNTAAWTIKTEADVNSPTYGVGVFAKRVDENRVNLSVNATSMDDWLDTVYYSMAPLVDPRVELRAAKPTHFRVTYAGATTEYSVRDWDQNIILSNKVLPNGNINIVFVRKTASGDMYLSVCGMAIKDII